VNVNIPTPKVRAFQMGPTTQNNDFLAECPDGFDYRILMVCMSVV
jgi:hypothetical protein